MHFLAHDLALALALAQRAMNHSKIYFDHEKFFAYQRSIEFVGWASQLLEELPPKLAVCDQLDRASTSVPLNIAEGNAKFTAPDRCRYWATARGSALNARLVWTCLSLRENPAWTEHRRESGSCLRPSHC